MFDFNPMRVGCGGIIVLSALIAAGCDYTPPKVDTDGAGGEGGGSSTSSSSSSSNSSTTSSSSSSSSSSGVMPENCTNDVDDDQNGSKDCADPACSTLFQCTPSVPAEQGWSAPFHAALVPYDATPPPCETGNSPLVYGFGQLPHVCKGCKCAVTGAPCTGEQLTCYSDFTCNPGMFQNTFVGPGCHYVTGYTSCQVTTIPMFDPGFAQCNASGGGLTYPNPFAQKILRCDTPTNTGGGCMPGQVCAQLPAVGYDRLCIAASGNQPCPAGWGQTPYVVYGSFTNNRGCTACSCDLNQATCEGNAYVRHSNTSCTMPVGGNIPIGACVPVGQTITVKYDERAPNVLPNGCRSDPTGFLDLGPETTICCGGT